MSSLSAQATLHPGMIPQVVDSSIVSPPDGLNRPAPWVPPAISTAPVAVSSDPLPSSLALAPPLVPFVAPYSASPAAAPQFTLASAVPPVPPASFVSRPSPVPPAIRPQIIAGTYVDLAVLLQPSSCSTSWPRVNWRSCPGRILRVLTNSRLLSLRWRLLCIATLCAWLFPIMERNLMIISHWFWSSLFFLTVLASTITVFSLPLRPRAGFNSSIRALWILNCTVVFSRHAPLSPVTFVAPHLTPHLSAKRWRPFTESVVVAALLLGS